MNLTEQQLEEIRILRRTLVILTSRVTIGYPVKQSIRHTRRALARLLTKGTPKK